GPAFLSLGSHSASRGRLRAVHLGELDRRLGWLLHKSPYHPFARIDSGGGSDYRRHHWLASGESGFRRASDLALPRDSAGHCGNQINFHQVETPRLPVLSARGAMSLFSLGQWPQDPKNLTLTERLRRASISPIVLICKFDSRFQRSSWSSISSWGVAPGWN